MKRFFKTIVAIIIIFLLTALCSCDSSLNGYLAPVEGEQGWGYINESGRYVINPQFEAAYEFAENGLACVQEKNTGLFGYIDKSGKYVIEPKFSSVYTDVDTADTDFLFIEEKGFSSNGLALVLDPDSMLFGYIDSTGNYVIQPRFHWALEFAENGLAAAVDENSGTYGYIDETGKYVIETQEKLDICSFAKNGLAAVFQSGAVSGNGFGYIDETGDFVITQTFFQANEFGANDLAAVNIDELSFGYIDKTGKVVIEPRFWSTGEFASNGLAAARDKESQLYGYIDASGKYVIEPQFSDAGMFGENGLAPVADANRKWGYIDKTGKVIITPAFYYCKPFTKTK